MIKENQRFFNGLNVIADAVVIFLCFLLSFLLRFYLIGDLTPGQTLSLHIQIALAIMPLFVVIYAVLGLYESFRIRTMADEFAQIIKGNITAMIILVLLLFVFKIVDVSRWLLVIFFIVGTAGVTLRRFTMRRILKAARAQGRNLRHVIVVGSGNMARRYIETIRENRSFGFHLVGYVSSGDSCEAPEFPEIRRLCSYSGLEDLLTELNPDEVVVALESEEYKSMAPVISACEKTGTKISVIPFYLQFMSARPYVDEMAGIPLINIRRIPLDNFGNAAVKRLTDIVCSALGLIVTSPLLLVAAIGTRRSSPGPVIFRQTRVGYNKVPFEMYKFRTMRVNAEEDTAWSTNEDPRKTKFGSFLRKYSIDELPQLVNVLKGDMSLVGPRPELPHFVDQFKESVPMYMLKHQVRPGMTGWAQICGYRGDTSIVERIRCDIYYIENWTYLFDLRILAKTVFGAAFKNKEKLVK
jgi:Undecaprenyl-phosphate glucose phosphotransferase